MGKINLVRVDDRLIHGQVMTKWSKGLGTNALYVIDNETASDEFMKDIYINTNSSSGLKIQVYSNQEVVEKWNSDQFGKDNVVLLFKYIASVKEVVEQGLPVTRLNIGGVSKKGEAQFVIPTVALTETDVDNLKSLDAKGIEIFFQTVPDSKKVSLTDGLKTIKK
ncbi:MULTISPECIES: PTS system mannose/fructose/N-acetylgalactosamine-transporter subunit IIB [Niallia]|jgi:D-glucosaminate PTS system EIIB component|uniref:PTS system mannose/fructose/N-acetylgalactosamine-transporter subunit IIB n=1 Tax=Niallia TaxID=2837506 RepID=UPI000F44F247|nr:PTS sugar transporter subunit IIB [Niallia circulans]AYV73482.1 PTS mannose/fructose/sorbose transporter subunit IIB [Niallia circulans]NRG26006.1 PTS sugar transporter subunit IIB [Niallia circulans]